MMEPAETTPHIRADPELKESWKLVLEKETEDEGVVQRVTGEDFEHRRVPYLVAAPIMYILALYVLAKKLPLKVINLIAGLLPIKIREAIPFELKASPKINTLWVDALGTSGRYLRKYNPTCRALHFVYNYDREDARDRLDHFWLGNCNAQAVRNRKKIAKELLKQEIRQQAHRRSGKIRILSLASGSAQAVIQAIAELKDEVLAEAYLVDRDPAALSMATALANRHEVDDRLITRKTSVGRVARIGSEYEPHVVEMIGFLDYIRDEKARKYFKRIYGVLPAGGVFLTCNIFYNFEWPFTQFVVDWPMRYRSPKDILDLLKAADFKRRRVVCEPQKIHGIGIGRKFVQNQRNGEPPARQREFQLPRKVAEPVPKAARKPAGAHAR